MDITWERQKKMRWLYMIVGVVILLCVGLIYGWSVFRVPLEQDFGWTKAETSVTFTISMIMLCLGGLVSGVLTGKKGPRLTLCLCAFFLATGFIASSFIDSLPGLYAAYGGLAGFGVGLGYNCCISTCVKWFPDKQGLASGLTMFGFGGGAMIFGTLAASLIGSVGWRMTFLILGVVFAVLILAGAFIIKPVTKEFQEQVASAGHKRVQALEEVDWRYMLRRRNWWLYFSFSVFIAASGMAIFNISTVYANLFVHNLTQAAAIAGIVSIANGVGRIAFGQLFDSMGYKVTMSGVCLSVMAAAAILIAVEGLQNVLLLCAGFFLVGFGFGGMATCNSAFTAYFFGSKNYALNFSFVTFNVMPASIIGPACGSGSFTMTFAAMIVLAGLALAGTLLIRKPHVMTESNQVGIGTIKS